MSSPKKSIARRARAPTRPSAPTPDTKEMGMTAERQREIQASLFRMLGQADDVPIQSPNKISNAPSVSENSSSTRQNNDEKEVTHASTFPPHESSNTSVTVSSSLSSTTQTDANDFATTAETNSD